MIILPNLSNYHRISFNVLAFAIFCLLVSCDSDFGKVNRLNIKSGILDLGNYDIATNAPVVLSGEWEFYWNQLLEPTDFDNSDTLLDKQYVTFPSYWNSLPLEGKEFPGHGFATYRLFIVNNKPNILMSIKTRNAMTAFNLWVDDQLIFQNGVVGKDADSMQPGFSPGVKTFIPKNDTIQVVIQISNFSHAKGGMRGEMIIGNNERVDSVREDRVIYDLFLIGSIFIMSIYHFGLFYLQKKDKSTLYFGLLSLVVTVRIISTSEIVIMNYANISWELLQKMEYSTFVMILPLFLLFSKSLFPEEVSGKVVNFFILLSVIQFILVLFTKSVIYSNITSTNQAIIFVGGIYMLYVLICAIRKRKEGAIIFMSGYLVIFLTVTNDILYYHFLTPYGYLAPFGLFIFIFSQSFLLSKRFSKAFSFMEAYSLSLEQKVRERTIELEKKNETLNELNIEKDRMIDIVAHDLKSPFNKIKGFSQLIKMEGKLNEHQYSHIDQINRIVDAGNILIRDLLDMHAIEMEESVLTISRINLFEFLKEWKVSYEQNLVKKKQELTLNIDENINLKTDKELLNRIMDNLLSNAMKFSEKNTSITISGQNQDDKIHISIQDQGPGISKEEQNLMFKRFQKLSPRPTAGESSNGLGLSIIKELTTKLSGDVEVDSVQGKGSKFTITLPQKTKSRPPL